MNDYFDQVTDQIAIGRKIDAFADEWSRLCVEKWQRGIRDRLLADTIVARVHSRQAKMRAGDVIPFRRARLTQGEVLLGHDLAAPGNASAEIRLPIRSFGTHWLGVGSTGSAKTTSGAHVAGEIAAAGVSTWQISCYKRDLRGQLTSYRNKGLDLAVVRAQDLKLNPLQAGANEPRAHLTFATTRLEKWLNDVPPRAGILLRAICHELYREFQIFNGQRERWPTLFHVYERLRTAKGLNVPARDALLDRLGSFLERFSPHCGAWLKGWTPTDLVRNIVFEFKGAGEDVKGFLLESLLDHVFQREIERGVVNGPLKLFILVDDAQRIVNSGGSSAMNGLDEKVGLIRGCGIGVGFLLHTTYGVSPHVLPNLNFRQLGCSIEYETWMTMGRNMNMSPEQIEWGRLNLRRGWFVGAVAEGNWPEPFVFAAPHFSLSNNVTDADVLESQRDLAKLPVISADEFRNWERHPIAELQTDSTSPVLTPGEQRFLNAVVREPGKPAGYYARKLAMNGKAGRVARERLVQLALVREHKVQLNRRGKPSLVLEPLPAAAAFTSAEVT